MTRMTSSTTLFRTRTFSEWWRLFEGEDVCVGPGRDAVPRHGEFGTDPERRETAPRLGEHTDAWRAGAPACEALALAIAGRAARSPDRPRAATELTFSRPETFGGGVF